MSGIYIKGMDKETAVRICAYAGLRVDDSDFVPVPPHGDLIERDTLLKGDGRYIISFGKEGIDVAEIERAPTIIPASEKE